MRYRFSVLLLLLLCFFAEIASAHRGGAFFKNLSPFLKFITSAQNIYLSNCSGAVVVQTTKYTGASVNVVSDLTVNLTATASLTFYSDQLCTSTMSAVTIQSGKSSAIFYFTISSVGSANMVASATGYRDGAQTATAATNLYLWTGGGANANWTTAANWSGGSAPGSSNTAVFDSTCVTNCSPTINSSVTIGSLRIYSGYSGTITQASGAVLTVSSQGYSGGWYQESGSFVGSSGVDAINQWGSLKITGGSITASTGTWTNGNDFYVGPSATFNHNGGTVKFNHGCTGGKADSTLTLNSTALYDAYFAGSCHATFNLVSPATLTVLRNLTFYEQGSSRFNSNAIIEVSGNIDLQDWGGFNTGGKIKTVGVNQTINGNTVGYFPNVEIASSGTVTMTGTINIFGDYTHTSGSISAAGSNLNFSTNCGTGITTANITPGNQTYGNIGLTGECNPIYTLSGTLYAAGNVTFSNTNGNLNSGTISLGGNLIVSYWAGGTVQIMMTGASPSITQTGGTFPAGDLTYNAAGGTLTLASNASFNSTGQDINLTAGAVNMAGFSLTTKGLNLNSNTLTKNSGALTVNGVTVGTGPLYGGTIDP